jgi:hypothetical protein
MYFMGISTYVFSQTGGIFIANHENYSIIYINNITHLHYTHMTHMCSQLASSLAFNVASRSSRGLHSGWVEYVTSC